MHLKVEGLFAAGQGTVESHFLLLTIAAS